LGQLSGSGGRSTHRPAGNAKTARASDARRIRQILAAAAAVGLLEEDLAALAAPRARHARHQRGAPVASIRDTSATPHEHDARLPQLLADGSSSLTEGSSLYLKL